MVSFPPCKINLGLHITSKRTDGYHTIDTCYYPVPWTDILEIIPSEKFSFTATGITIPGNIEENLCTKAYRLIVGDYPIGEVSIHLHKIIPTGAGLGGGSSDAASTLLLINSIFELGLSTDQLKAYASRLGSDCAFFLENKPMIGAGRGEILSEFTPVLKNKYVVIVKPEVHVSTAEAYAAVVPKPSTVAIPEVLNLDSSQWRNALINDFEISVLKKYPEIGALKSKFYSLGAEYSCMSGSGSSVFGIFNGKIDLREKFKDSSYWAGYLN